MAPAGFPFEIEHPIDGDVTMKRELDGEEIEIQVNRVYEMSDEESDEESDSNSNSIVDLGIEIYKPDGKSMNFEATALDDGILIQKLTTKDGDNNVICSEMCIE